MKKTARIYFRLLLLAILLLACHTLTWAQQPQTPGSPLTINNAPQRDTNTSKTNTKDWKDYSARISYQYLNSEKEYIPDTSIHTFHRRPFLQPWYRNLGNHGGPVTNMFFTPEDRIGPTLGYHVFDVYRYDVDSMKYYNTNRPYSVFSFGLGSKQEQTAEIFHTQNIKPNWNFAVQYRKLTSPGYFQVQRTNHDNANFTTNYQSRNQHYQLNAAVVYNKEQNDENGGILPGGDVLDSPKYNDRQTIATRFYNENYGGGARTRRSPVSNMLRDASVMLQHSYTFGHTDTTYSEDSTSFRTTLTPRFRITHRMQYTNEKYQYRDMRPDSLKYTGFFEHKFLPAGQDSLIMNHEWKKFDNSLSLNGFIGKRENQLLFSAGAGIRADEFKTWYVTDSRSNKIFSNYLLADIGKEALKDGEWFYKASGMFYLTGDASGSSVIQGSLGKSLRSGWAGIELGAKQEIGVAPYNYTVYQTQYDTIVHSFNKESITRLYGTLESERLQLSAGIRSYLISNYIYLDTAQMPAQYATSFNVTQLWLRKVFVWHSFVFDNELVYQQQPAGAPVNVPALLGRHQLSFEKYIFNHALKIATGVQVQYHSPYKPAGYAPFFNRFYYQNSYQVSNAPETSAFFNFKIKRFRAYIMADQLQQLFTRNIIITRGYPGPNMMIRFGFSWVMIN